MFVIYDDKKCKVVLDAAKYKLDTENKNMYGKSFLLEVNDVYNCWSKKDVDEYLWYYDYLEDGKYYWWVPKDAVIILKNKNMEIE